MCVNVCVWREREKDLVGITSVEIWLNNFKCSPEMNLFKEFWLKATEFSLMIL